MEWDFVANATVEDLAKVPTVYQGLYTKGTDGKFVISDAAKGIVEAYTGISAAHKQTRLQNKELGDECAQRRVAHKQVKEYITGLGLTVKDDGSDLITVLGSHVTDLTGKVKNGQEVQVNVAKIQDEANRRIAEVTTAKDGEITKMRGSLEKYLVGQAAATALAGAKGSVELLMPHINQHCKVVADGDNYVVRVVDAQGDVKMNGKGGYMVVEDLVASMKTDDKFARAFESEAPGGGGKRPGSGAVTPPVRKDGERTSVGKISAGLAARAR